MAEGNSNKLKERRGTDIPEKKADAGVVAKTESFLTPIVEDVIIPSAEDTFINIVQTIADGIVNSVIEAVTHQPSNRRVTPRTRTRTGRNGVTSYDRVNRSSTVRDRRDSSVPEATRLRDLRLDNRADAVEVIHELQDICSRFGRVTCNELYGLEEIDKTCPYTYANWGWTDVSDAGIIDYGNGQWGLDLPKPILLNK